MQITTLLEKLLYKSSKRVFVGAPTTDGLSKLHTTQEASFLTDKAGFGTKRGKKRQKNQSKILQNAACERAKLAWDIILRKE